MVRHPILFIFSILLCQALLAQEEDSVVIRRFLTPSVYVDYGKLLTIPSKAETKYEAGLELTFYERIPLIVEVGSGILTPPQAFSNGIYESNGIYFRVGVGYVAPLSPKNDLGITFRYGMSSFSESSRFVIESTSGIQSTLVREINRSGLSGSWFETVIYSDRKLNDLFSIGMNLRLRVLINYDRFEPIDVYAIPGYGRTFDKSVPGVNFFVKASF